MSTNPLAKKLQIRAHSRLALLNAPEGMAAKLEPLPEGVEFVHKPSRPVNCVVLFAANESDLAAWVEHAFVGVDDDTVWWIAYPKKSGRIDSDLTRDAGWDVVQRQGYRPVAQVAVDSDWSALRWRPTLVQNETDAVDALFAGEKASLRPLYDGIVEIVYTFGDDVSLAPRKSYVSFVRKTQFGLVRPARRDTIDIGLKLNPAPSLSRLSAAGNLGSGSMTHRVSLQSVDELDDEVVDLLRLAYDQQAV